MAQKIRVDNIDVAIMSESQWRAALTLASASQDVKIRDVKVLIVLPDSSTPDDYIAAAARAEKLLT